MYFLSCYVTMNGDKYMCALLCTFIMQLLDSIINDQYYSKIASYPINGEPNALSTCGLDLPVLKDVSGIIKALVSNLVV